MVIAEGKQRVQMFNPHTVLFCNLFFFTSPWSQQMGRVGTLCGSPFATWECAMRALASPLPFLVMNAKSLLKSYFR